MLPLLESEYVLLLSESNEPCCCRFTATMGGVLPPDGTKERAFALRPSCQSLSLPLISRRLFRFKVTSKTGESKKMYVVKSQVSDKEDILKKYTMVSLERLEYL